MNSEIPISSNKVKISVKEDLWSNITDRESETFKIFLYDVYYNLYDNLNRIKRLQLFSIQDFSEDILGNQWFTYKPKYSNFLTTKAVNESENIDIYDDIEAFKNPKNIIKNSKSYAGELWVRLKNFPFAYPFQYVTTATDESVWGNVAESEIYKSQICDNLGYILYGNSSGKHIIFFSVNSEFRKDEFPFTGDLINRLEKILTVEIVNQDAYNGEVVQLDSVPTTRKSAPINILSRFDFKENTFIDAIYHNSEFFLFYSHPNTLTDMTIKMKKVSSDMLLQSNYNLSAEGNSETLINLPSYTYGSSNICKPKNIKNWSISVSAENINIAYEAEPYSM